MEHQDQSGTESITRRERRELRRQERRQKGRSQRRRNLMKRALLWVGVVAAIALIGWAAWQAAKSVPTSNGAVLVVPVTEADHSLGPDDAPVTIVEYSDFQCPGCAAFNPVVMQILEEPELDGQVRLVYRHFPLTNIHPNAVPAARAAEAAALQGMFWEMHDLIFEGQDIWSGQSTSAARETFAGYAGELGLDIVQWEADLESDTVISKVDADTASAQQSAVTSTPSFFVNGEFVDIFASNDVAGAFRQSLIDAINANP